VPVVPSAFTNPVPPFLFNVIVQLQVLLLVAALTVPPVPQFDIRQNIGLLLFQLGVV